MGREVAGAEGGPPLGDEQVDGDQAQHRQCHAHYTQGAREAVSTNRFVRTAVDKYPFVTNFTSGKYSVADMSIWLLQPRINILYQLLLSFVAHFLGKS